MKNNCFFVFLSVIFLMACQSGFDESRLQIIPQPVELKTEQGSFRLDRNTELEYSGYNEESRAAELLNQAIFSIAGYNLSSESQGKTKIRLMIDSVCSPNSSEGYHLQIQPEMVELKAANETGLFYGIQTFIQLLADRQFFNIKKQSWQLPALQITDYPAFPYRGLHLDVSRHFFPKEFVMKMLDLMSVYKLNKLHWHLTDAAGWRIEIKKYPELTSRAAWRTQENYMDWWNSDRRYLTRDSAGAYGGFYTQEEIREVVDYAATKHITIIPEIEMPGHSEEVVSVYPELSCSGKPYQNGELCIGNEKTFEFVENVLTEVMALFPSEYIHIGGDEASRAAWRRCPKCQKRIRDEHLKDEKELQSYMIHRVGAFLNSKKRKLIGWDEILDGGLAPDATVMSWRGESGGIKAARMGHDVIMTPGGYCYFDSFQADPRTQPAAIGGFLPYLKVYSYYPVPKELTQQEARHILGAQANLWAEYIPTTSHAEYMLFPRLLSLSEVVWSPRENKDPEDFKRRVAFHIEQLKEKEVNVFPLSDHIELLTEVDTVGKRIKVAFESEKYQPRIHYIMNNGKEQVYKKPFYVTDSAHIKAFIVKDGQPADEVLDTRVDYHRAIGKKVTYQYLYHNSYPAAGTATLTDGLRGGLTYGDGRWQGFLSGIDVVIDLGETCDLSYVSANFMQLTGPGVYMPVYVAISVSENGETFQEVARINNEVPMDKDQLVIRDFTARFKASGRYVKLYAKRNLGFQFIDEIVIY